MCMGSQTSLTYRHSPQAGIQKSFHQVGGVAEFRDQFSVQEGAIVGEVVIHPFVGVSDSGLKQRMPP